MLYATAQAGCHPRLHHLRLHLAKPRFSPPLLDHSPSEKRHVSIPLGIACSHLPPRLKHHSFLPMNLRTYLLAAMALLPLSLQAEIQGRTVEYKSGDATLEGFVAYDDSAK